MTPESYRDLQLNAQVISAIQGSLSNEEYRKVIGIGNAKVLWDIIKMSHEGDKKARRTNLETVETELRKFEWIKGESLRSLFDRLMVLINRTRSYGSKDWPDDKVTRLFLDAYQDKDWHMARMIRDRDDYKDMTPHQLFAKINSTEVAEARRKVAGQE